MQTLNRYLDGNAEKQVDATYLENILGEWRVLPAVLDERAEPVSFSEKHWHRQSHWRDRSRRFRQWPT